MPTGPVLVGKPVEISFIWDNGGQEAKDFCGSIGKFGGALKNPMAPLGKAVCGCNHADWKPALQQLLVMHFWTAALIAPGLLVFLMFGLLAGGLGFSLILGWSIQGVLTAFILTWFMWYCLSDREKSCCCCIVAVVEHPLVGVLWGVGMVGNGVQLILRSRAFTLLGWYGWVVFIGIIVYGVVTIFCGVAAIRVGMAQSGIEAPAMPNTGVGKAEEAKPAAAVEENVEKPADAADAV